MFGEPITKYELLNDKLTVTTFSNTTEPVQMKGIEVVLLQKEPIPKPEGYNDSHIGYAIYTGPSFEGLGEEGVKISRYGFMTKTELIESLPDGKQEVFDIGGKPKVNEEVSKLLDDLKSGKIKEGDVVPDNVTMYLHQLFSR